MTSTARYVVIQNTGQEAASRIKGYAPTKPAAIDLANRLIAQGEANMAGADPEWEPAAIHRIGNHPGPDSSGIGWYHHHIDQATRRTPIGVWGVRLHELRYIDSIYYHNPRDTQMTQ